VTVLTTGLLIIYQQRSLPSLVKINKQMMCHRQDIANRIAGKEQTCVRASTTLDKVMDNQSTGGIICDRQW